MIWAILAAGLVAFLIWLGYGARYVAAVTNGPTIPQREGSALLMIDLQTVFWDDKVYDSDTMTRVEQAVQTQVNAAKQAGDPIIAIRHEWSIPSTKLVVRVVMGGKAIEGTPGTEFAPAFAGHEDYEVVKRVGDAFETGELDQLLEKLDVGHLTIVGLDGEHCVAKTSEAALNRGYEVKVVTDGVATARKERAQGVFAKLRTRGAQIATV